MNKTKNLDFIFIGTGRSATSWIYKCLGDHPEVCVSRKKEPTLFCDSGDIDAEFFTENFTEDSSSLCKTKGTFPPTFMLKSDNAEKLKKFFPDIKIIVSLRNPASKMYSLYWLRRSTGRIPKGMSFEGFIETDSSFANHGFYYKQLKPFFDLFKRENIFVVFYDDIVDNPAKSIKSICSFLGIAEYFKSDFIEKRVHVSTKKGLKFFFLDKIVKTTLHLSSRIKKNKTGGTLLIFLKKLRVHQVLNIINSFNILKPDDRLDSNKKEIPEMFHSTDQKLKKIYKNDIENLESLLGTSLGKWK